MKIIIADNYFLSRIGLEFIIKKYFKNAPYIISLAEGFKFLSNQIKFYSPDIVLLDYVSTNLSADEVEKLIIRYPSTKFILITEWIKKSEILQYFQKDIKWHLLKECDEQEIKECIEYAMNNQSFFCNKLVQFIQSNNEEVSPGSRNKLSCDGIVITQREREIIQWIAQGYSNKQIADHLNISIHTVFTHRKNIMKKTNANNTAGLVFFALKNKLITSSNHFLFAENS